jgi:hypothetical protein
MERCRSVPESSVAVAGSGEARRIDDRALRREKGGAKQTSEVTFEDYAAFFT